ncbi:MAG: LrgB family protein [Rickettsiaceae bacterium]|nr:LrgB family protein [Rickettsiaceae bacterium]
MRIELILCCPTTALFVTTGSYLIGNWFKEKIKGYNIVNPTIIAIFLVIIYINIFNIPYENYLKSANLIHGLIDIATVALAIPLYNKLVFIKKSILSIFSSVIIACLVASLVAYYLATLMGSSEAIKFAIIPKSTTTPIAINIAEQIKSDPSLVVFFVFTTGIVGALIAPIIFKLFAIEDHRAIGLSLGITSHGIGVAKAFQYSEKAGAFSALGMGLMGIISGIFLPLLVLFLKNY